MVIENFKEDLTSNLKKLAGVVAVGTPWWGFDAKAKPAGVQLFSGQLLSRASYSAHWGLVNGGSRTVVSESEWQSQVSSNGFCLYYSSGDGSTTYRMPLVKGVHPKFVSALTEAGKYFKAGLPNITGEAGYFNSLTDHVWSGALYNKSSKGTADSNNGGTTAYLTGLDASRSNPIYGNSDTVQPPSIAFVLGEYVVGSVATVGEANAESLLASMTRLESTVGALQSGSSFNASGKAEIVSWGMPDYSAGVTVSSFPFTAPSTGVLEVLVDANGAAKYLTINNVTFVVCDTSAAVTMQKAFNLSKGDVVRNDSSTTGTMPLPSNSRGAKTMFFPLKGA